MILKLFHIEITNLSNYKCMSSLIEIKFCGEKSRKTSHFNVSLLAFILKKFGPLASMVVCQAASEISPGWSKAVATSDPCPYCGLSTPSRVKTIETPSMEEL